MDSVNVRIMLVGGVLVALPVICFLLVFFPVWWRYKRAGCPVPLETIVGFIVRRTSPLRLLETYRPVVKHGPPTTNHRSNLEALEKISLVGESPEQAVADYIHNRQKEGLPPFENVCSAHLIGLSYEEIYGVADTLNENRLDADGPWTILGGVQPESFAALRELLSTEEIADDAIVFCPETKSWRPIVDIPQLRQIIFARRLRQIIERHNG